MSINAQQLRELIVRPVLQQIGWWTQAAENLLMGTAAQESQMGTYIHQINGPALGIYQIEPATHQDIWTNYLSYKVGLSIKVAQYGKSKDDNQLIWNLAYSTAIARLIYARDNDELPDADDIQGLARYYKLNYNTHRGDATVQQFIDNYHRYVL